MNNFKVIAFTHKTLELSELGKLHIEEAEMGNRLQELKSSSGIQEVMMLSTCNRIEFLISLPGNISKENIEAYLRTVYPLLSDAEIFHFVSNKLLFEGEEALRHLFNVASSLDSLVVGEREIITQVRNSYEICRKSNLTGDLLRLVIQRTIECAKQVYTLTNIAKNPVSVVSLAYRKLKSLNVKLDARFIIVGAGVTNTTMAKYLKKHGFSNFVVFNRTVEHGEKLAGELSSSAYPLEQLSNYHNGFDVIVTCTGSSGAIITREIYQNLVGNDTSRKIVIDLAVPNDLDPEILKSYDVNLIAVNNLQEIAQKNLAERQKELSSCRVIIEENLCEFEREFRERKVELAMSQVPKKIREIREIALNEVFAKDVGKLDQQSKETLDKVISYLEKKYISMPMKMAKEILIEEAATK